MSITKDLNLFQIIIIGVFIFIGVAGIAIFATSKANSGGASYSSLIWGVLPKTAIDDALVPARDRGANPNFTYVEYPEEGFAQALLEAIAEGRGPDAIIFPNYMYYSQFGKLLTVPSEVISIKTFLETYIDAARPFSVQDGIKAYPLVVDPLVMYWNRDMFASEGILAPPKSWSELAKMTNEIALKNDNGVVTRAFVALGEYANVDHSKKIIFTLLSQVGVNMSHYDAQNNSYTSGLLNSTPEAAEKTRSVFTYYTEFANPLKSSYTWNRSFTSSRDAFLAGDLALYFAPGSEVEYIRSRNPNLGFGATTIPQENPNIKSVHGRTYALAFLVSSRNPNASIAEITRYLTTAEASNRIAVSLGMAPARRDALATSKVALQDSNLGAIYESAVYAKDWLDPNPTATNEIFKNMIESITSGRQTLYEAIQDASDRLSGLF